MAWANIICDVVTKRLRRFQTQVFMHSLLLGLDFQKYRTFSSTFGSFEGEIRSSRGKKEGYHYTKKSKTS